MTLTDVPTSSRTSMPTTSISRRTHQRVMRGWFVGALVILGRLALSKKLRNLVSGDSALANDAPARRFIA